MLDEVTISGFKSIAKLTEPLELGTVNVLVGSNGSGKSNILEAIGVLSAAASGSVNDQTLISRGVRPGTPALFKTSLSGSGIQPFITFFAKGAIGGTDVSYKVSLDNPISDPSAAWSYHAESVFQGAENVFSRTLTGTGFPKTVVITGLSGKGRGTKDTKSHRTADVIGLAGLMTGLDEEYQNSAEFISRISSYGIFTPNTEVLRGTIADTKQRDPMGLTGGRLAEAVLSLLNKTDNTLGVLDLETVLEILDWVSDIDVVSPSATILSPSVPTSVRVIRFTDRFMRETRNQITGFDASEGALYALFLLVLALHPKSPALFAIDNFDQALNPRLARRLMRLFADTILQSATPRQVLITTHNPTVLDGLDLSNDRIRLFTVERGRNGETRVIRVKVSPEILHAEPGGLPLSTLWVMGRLGGVPDL